MRVPMPASRAITKLLIANRGEIAARIARTAHGLGLRTVAVYSDPDADAPYVTLADEAVRLPGAAPADTYLRGDLIIAAAAATGADAVHPGYGFLSENAAFARACADAGLIFVGPAADTIEAMGDKVRAKAIMADADVPVLPSATVTDTTDLTAAGASVGFPLLVKAAFGGGGRGMRLVTGPEELAEAVSSGRSEAASAFGDGTVFLERYVTDPRHVEVQILGDAHGNVVHLFERECSIQRRYQKIVEECPSPAVDDDLREALTAAAVAAGWAIGYTGAGTVEFVLDRDGKFYFLEMNTRLQVEHPVTEEVTGLDLVELQLLIAEGEPLPARAREARISGHAIEVRLYAEDVAAGFAPATGVLHRFRFPAAPGIRVDTGFRDGSVVSPHYDAMLAKVVAHGPTRADAARRLARALGQAGIHGVTTNRDLLVAILREPEFLAGGTDTGYLTRHEPAALAAARAGPPAIRWSRRSPGRRGTAPRRPSCAPCRPAGAMSSPARSASAIPRPASPARLPTGSAGTTSTPRSTASRCGRSSARPPPTRWTWRSTAPAGCTACTRSAPTFTSTPAMARAPCPRSRGSAIRPSSRRPARCWPRCPAWCCGCWPNPARWSPRVSRSWSWRR